MKARGVHNVSHYLDDYIIMGSPKSTECGKDLEKACASGVSGEVLVKLFITAF